METSLKTGFAQVFSCCPKNLSCPNFGGGAAAPLAPPARTPMNVAEFSHKREKWEEGERQAADALSYVAADQICGRNCLFHKTEFI